MPLGFTKTALLGAAGASGGFEHWFGLFPNNSTYYISGGVNGLALDSSDNIGLAYSGNGSPDGTLASAGYPFNAVIDKTGILQWAKALGPTSGQTIKPRGWPMGCGFKNTTNGKFYLQIGLNSGGQFGSNPPNYSTNEPMLLVDINDATGALNSDLCIYESYNAAVALDATASTEIHTISGTDYLYSGYKYKDTTGNTYCPVGLLRQQLNSSGGFAGTPTKYGYYVSPSSSGGNIGQNIYAAGYQGVDFGINGSGAARFATVGYAYYSGDGAARFIPYLLMFDEDGSNFSQTTPYLYGVAKGGYNYGVYVDGSHNAYCLQAFTDPTSVITPALVHKFNSSAVSQSFKAYKGDGNGFSLFSHGAEDSSGNLYFAGTLNINHDSVNNVGRAFIIKFNSSFVPQWYRAIDVEPADASSTRYSQTAGLKINSDGNICWSFVTGQNEYSVGGAAVLPADGSGTGTYSIDGHTLEYLDISSKITDVSSNFSFSYLSRFSSYSHTLASIDTLTPEQNGGSNVPASIELTEVT